MSQSVIISLIIANTYRRCVFLSKTTMSNRCHHRRCVCVGWCCANPCLSWLLIWVQPEQYSVQKEKLLVISVIISVDTGKTYTGLVMQLSDLLYTLISFSICLHTRRFSSLLLRLEYRTNHYSRRVWWADSGSVKLSVFLGLFSCLLWEKRRKQIKLCLCWWSIAVFWFCLSVSSRAGIHEHIFVWSHLNPCVESFLFWCSLLLKKTEIFAQHQRTCPTASHSCILVFISGLIWWIEGAVTLPSCAHSHSDFPESLKNYPWTALNAPSFHLLLKIQ